MIDGSVHPELVPDAAACSLFSSHPDLLLLSRRVR
jgi:hypothetical protein